MYLESLRLLCFRNYSDFKQEFSPQINLLVGENAQGKTNLIEAIYYLSTGRTYRSARDAQLISWNRDKFSLLGQITNRLGKANIEITYNNKEKIGKEVKINGIRISKLSDLLGCLTTVLFAPEDLSIIKGAPSERRRLLDQDISQVSPNYYLKLQKYNRLLNQRNHLLKNLAVKTRRKDELDVWDQLFLEVSAEIITKRLHVLEKLSPLARLMQRRLTDGIENLDIRYVLNRRTEIKKNDNILALLHEEMVRNRNEEIKKAVTLWGPHRDDLSIQLNGNDLKYYGSQGQHRTAVLALKLAEIEFFKAESGEYPVLLLDDVLSELDQQRRNLLIQTIQDKHIQCFITTTEDLQAIWKKNTSIAKFEIIQGTVNRQ